MKQFRQKLPSLPSMHELSEEQNSTSALVETPNTRTLQVELFAPATESVVSDKMSSFIEPTTADEQ